MQISRARLYELVSQSPLSRVAPGLEVSATVLAAICREHKIPYPGSLYWTRKSLGQPVSLTPLPILDETADRPITIEPKAKRPSPAPIQSNTDGAQASKSQFSVKERLNKPHALIAKWIAEHDQRLKEFNRDRSHFGYLEPIKPLSEIDHRRHRILDALFRELEAKGGRISQTEKGLVRVTIDNENIDFQLREKNKQVTLSPDDSRRTYRSMTLVGTGKLVFAISTYLRRSHNEEWLENDRKTMESYMPEIIERLFEGVMVLKDWHREQEEERERSRKREAERIERQRLAKQDKARKERLAQLARDLETSRQIRHLLTLVSSTAFDHGKRIHGRSMAEWLEWSNQAADELDKTQGGMEGVFSIIGGVDAQPANPYYSHQRHDEL